MMLRNGILNPQINALLSRIRHTNTLVIADRGFPFWPQVETVDLSLVDDIPTVLNVLEAISHNFIIGKAWMAEEFREKNPATLVDAYVTLLPPIDFDPHTEFKRRVPHAIGIIRTADTSPYSNVILESA
jgi:D-ribose pyranase